MPRHPFVEFLGIVGGVAAFIAAIMLAVLLIGKSVDHRACRAFARSTGRQTHFVTYTFFQWDCLVRSSDGKWIPKDNLREFTK